MPISSISDSQEIHDLLLRATHEITVPLKFGGNTELLSMTSLPDSFQRGNRLHKLVVDSGWPAHSPALQAIQRWIEAHWNAGRPTQRPPGTVVTGQHLGLQCRPRLDDAIASRKLVVAAALCGPETAARYAVDFALYGMVEAQEIHLLKGPSVAQPQHLDDYCTLLPYRQALRQANLAFGPTDSFPSPPENASGICALACTGFVRADPHPTFEDEWLGTPLIQHGAETLAVVIGLVWGTGLRLIQTWRAMPVAAEAVLPFWMASGGGGTSYPVELLPEGFPRLSKQRPLPAQELVELMDKYCGLTRQSYRRLDIALRRLRNASEKLEEEDRVIDLCIALEALFTEAGEWKDQRKTIARRGSWHFADSVSERQRVRDTLKRFYNLRSDIVHGNPASPKTREEADSRSSLISDVFDVVRASLKTMIVEGRPQDWDSSLEHKSIRHDPPRDESQILSVKSDSLSWTVEELKEIDHALEAVWKPTVDRAPTPAPGTNGSIHRGINPEAIEQCRQQGRSCVVRHPAVLYMAHPKWPRKASDPLDERTEFYCERDVERHMRRWAQAASRKGLDQFDFPCHAPFFHPKNQQRWPQPLQ